MRCKNIFISRHGVRPTQLPEWAEPCHEPYDGPDYDLPLAPLGRQQAVALAERMRDIPLDFIFCSPFRRTVESAVPLARLQNISIKLEWGIAEWLKESWFESFPQLPTAAERSKEFPEVDPDYRSMIEVEYPEDLETHRQRKANAAVAITENFGPNVFVMGHGGSLRNVLSDVPNLFQDYCGISQLTFRNGKWSYTIEGETGYLKSKNIHVPGRRSVSRTR